MQKFVCLLFIGGLITAICAHPTDNPAAAADKAKSDAKGAKDGVSNDIDKAKPDAKGAKDGVSDATDKAKPDAKGAKDGVSNADDLAKKVDPKKAIAAMTKEAKDLNPINVAALAGKFVATIIEASKEFIQGVSKSLSPSPSALPGVGEISKMTKLFNPLEIGKNAVDDVLKIFGGTPSKPPKEATDVAKDTKDKAAKGTEAAGKKADDKADAAKDKAKPDEGKNIVAKVEEAGTDMVGGLFKSFGF